MPLPTSPLSPSSLEATDREEEVAGFIRRMKLQQEQDGACEACEKNVCGNRHCPILWWVVQ